MFIRFRRTKSKLQVSIVETARLHGKVHQRYIASFGSLPLNSSAHDRIEFWARANQKLDRLSNRISADVQAKLRAEIHSRIPLPTAHEQRAVQKANALADAQIWSALHDLNAADAQGHRALADRVAKTAMEVEARAETAKRQAAAAADRLAALQRGENVQGGLGKPVTFDAAARAAGWSNADLRRMRRLGELSEHEFQTELLPRLHQAKARTERAAINAVWRETARRRCRGGE